LLHTAASLCMSKLVPALFKNGGFDINAQDGMGFTALALACRNGSTDLITVLLSGALISTANHAHDSPLHLALAAGNDAVAWFLIGNCADIDARGREKKTPLHLAAAHGNTETARLLLDLGADVEALDGSDRTPLCVCAGASIAQMLVDHGADVNYVDSNGWTALHHAVARECIDTFNVLVGAGANLDARTVDDGLDVYDRIERLDEEVVGSFRKIARLPC
jgi:ankyrin repeat protein